MEYEVAWLYMQLSLVSEHLVSPPHPDGWNIRISKWLIMSHAHLFNDFEAVTIIIVTTNVRKVTQQTSQCTSITKFSHASLPCFLELHLNCVINVFSCWLTRFSRRMSAALPRCVGAMRMLLVSQLRIELLFHMVYILIFCFKVRFIQYRPKKWSFDDGYNMFVVQPQQSSRAARQSDAYGLVEWEDSDWDHR